MPPPLDSPHPLTRSPVHPLTGPRDVVVIGSGLAGSGIAAALAQRGWDVLLLERDRLPRHKVCGEFLSPEAQHSLAQLGVLNDVAALNPLPLHGAAVITAGGISVQMALPAPAWGLSRYALDAGLAAAAERCGAEFRPGCNVTGVQQMPEGAVVRLRCEGEEQAVRARCVIAACGRHSTAALPPRNTGGDKRGWRHCVGLKRHYTGVVMEPHVELYLFPGGYVGINGIEGGRANVCALVTYEAFQTAGKSLDCVLAAAVERHPQLGARLAGAQPVRGSECAVAPVDTERRPAPWDPQLAAPCLGDTAAMIPPLAGDGMAMALRSAELCLEGAHAWLSDSLSTEGWAAAYTRAWGVEFGRRLRLGRALQRGLTVPHLGDLLAKTGQLLPPLAALMFAHTRGRLA